MAAGQEQKKAAQLSPKPQQKNQPKLQTQPQPPQQQKQQHLPSQNTTSPTITKPQQKPSQPNPPQQQQPQTVTIKQTIQPQKPLVTTSTVQPPTQHSPITSSTPTIVQARPIPATSIASKVTEQIKSKLPQLPPRVQSQSSVTSRGPPPAIPPRSNATPLPNRSESVQIPSKSDEPLNRTLTRQASVNSIPPQYTPQPPPKFVIPQRQNSRTSLGRHNSVSGPSASSPTSSSGSPQMTRKH